MAQNTTHGITADGHGWTHTSGTMPRATNAYWTDDRRIASELRYQDSKVIPMPIIDADKRTIVAAMEAAAQARDAAFIVAEIEDRNKYYNREPLPVIRCAKCNEPVITHRQSSPDCTEETL